MLAALPFLALVKRELLTHLRRVRVFWILLLVVGVLEIVLVALWPQPSAYNYGRGGGFGGNVLYQVLMGLTSAFVLMAAAVCIPPLAAASIVGEKEQETFDLLSLTLIRPSGILLGKLCNALGFFFLALVAVLPVFATVFFSVGVDFVQIVSAFAILVATAVSCATISLACSACCRKTVTAMMASYLLIFLAMGGILPVLAVFVGAVFSVRSISYMMSNWLTIICPIGVLERIFVMGGGASDSLVLGLIYQCALSLTAWLVAVWALRRPPKAAVAPPARVIDDPETLSRRRRRFPFYLVDPLRRKKTIEDGRNPMFVRELRWGLMNRATGMIRLFYVAFVVYLFLGIGATFFSQSFETMEFWLGTQIVVTVAGAPLLTANSFTKEYELGNIDMLRITLLRPSEIIMGKIYAGAFAMMPLLLAAFLSCIPVLPFASREWPAIFSGYVTLIVCSFLSLALGFFASVLTKRSNVSLILGYLFSIAVYLGVFLMGGLLESFDSGIFRLSDRGGGALFFGYFSPLLALFAGWYGFSVREGASSGSLAGFFVYWGSNMFFSVIFSLLLIRWSMRVLERRMRDA